MTIGHKKQALPNLLRILLSILFIFSTAHAQSWTGAVDSDFNNTGNWSGGNLPSGSEIAFIRGNVANNNPVVLNGSASMGQIRIGRNAGAGLGAALNLNSGSTLGTTTRVEVGYSLSGDASGGVGSLRVNGGTHNLSAISVGNSAGSNNANSASGTVTINAGTVNLSSGSSYLGTRGSNSTGSSTGSLTIAGGSLHSNTTFEVGHVGSGSLSIEGGSTSFNNLVFARSVGSSANLNLSGGTMNVSGGFNFGADGTNGTFALNMSGGTILLDRNRATNLLGILSDQDVTLTITGGLLEGGTEATNMANTYGTNLNEITLGDGHKILMGYDGTAGNAGKTAIWTTAPIPEPPTYALFGGFLALLFVMIRHRK